MSDKNRTNYGEVVFCLCMVLAIFLFVGEPDIHDAIREYVIALTEQIKKEDI